jgi:tungstate transport system substrate-binding protein
MGAPESLTRAVAPAAGRPARGARVPAAGRRSGPVGALLLALFVVPGLAACGAGDRPTSPPLTLGTTTTIEDSGLLSALIAAFREAHPDVHIRTVTGGTGEVLALGRRGDVAVVLTHDPAAESTFVAEGYGIDRRPVMWNDFVIAGPGSDPAGLRGMRDAAAAFAAIARFRATFVSRGDESGTHRKEFFLWREAGLSVPKGGVDRWYIAAGVGMGDALRLASARGAYILTDRATFRVLRPELDLEILVEGDPRLVNRYAATRIRGAPQAEVASVFVEWLTSAEGLRAIREFGRDRYGEPLYFVDARPGG